MAVALQRLAMAIVLAALPARATVYYVDNVGGSDTNNGTSTTTAWQHCPGDPAATGTAASTTIGADTIYFKGGVTYLLSSSKGIQVSYPPYTHGSIGASFSSGDKIGWGAGMAVIDGNGIATHWFQVSGETNVTFVGLDLQNTVNQDGNAALYFWNSSSNLVTGCWIHDAGTNVTSSPGVDCVEFSGPNGAGYNVITNCILWRSGQKLIETTGGCNNNIVVNNVCHDSDDHAICISTAGNIVCGNIITNVAIGHIMVAPFRDPVYGIKLSSDSAVSPNCSSNLVYNNLIAHCMAGINIEDVGSNNMVANYIFNNTVADCGYNTVNPDGLLIFNVTASGTHIDDLVMNNIFCGEQSDGGWGYPLIRLTSGVAANGLGRDNIIAYNFWGTPTANATAMVYVSATQTPSFVSFADSGSTSPDFRFANPVFGSGNSFVTNSQIFNIDPQFVSYPSDLTLASGSPCAGTGTNLSAYFTTDIRGTTRTIWSMGAYETPSSAALAPPSALRVVGAN